MATPKKTIQDIKLPARKTAKSVTVQSARKIGRAAKTVREPKTPSRVSAAKARVRVVRQPEPIVTENFTSKKRSRGWFWVTGIAVIVLCVGLAYGALFHSAVLLITPKHATVTSSNASIVLAKEPTTHQVPLVVMSLSDTVTKTVRSTGSQDVQQKASGEIIVYNNFSTSPQKLLEETRFETPDGKIYKTAKGNPITIPGMTNGKPGQAQVTIYASEPGDAYNKEPSDFTIPGFKGTAKYTKFYARSVGPITGGFTGTQASIPADEQQRLTADIGAELGDRLKAEALLQKTDEFIIFDQASKVSIADPKITPASDNPLQATLSVTGTFSTILINKDELAKELASQLLPNYQGEPVTIKNIDSLTLAASIPEGQDVSGLDTVTVTISGDPVFVFVVPEAQLKEQLLAIQRKQINGILLNYPSIDTARFIIKPFWKSKAPADRESVKIKYNLD